jgi:RND family efflux transporter MFP subunit
MRTTHNKQNLLMVVLGGIMLIFMAFCQPAEKKNSVKEPGHEGNLAKNQDTAKGEMDTDAIPVAVVMPKKGDISSFLLFSSNVDSEQTVDVFPMTSAIVTHIYFDEGDRVNRDSVLAQLDDREASINEEKSKNTFLQLENEFLRQTKLYETKMISKEEYERLKFNLEQARLDWQQKKLFLSYTKITSPIQGILTKRNIKTGNRVNLSEIAFSLVNNQEKIVVVNIPEQEKNSVFLKQKAFISADGKDITGFVKRISPAIDFTSGTFKVTVAVLDSSNHFMIGQFVNVKIINKTRHDVILLHKNALIYDGGNVYVFTVDSADLAFRKKVELGFDNGVEAEIMNGIDLQAKVVTAGKSSLKNQAKVKIVENLEI